MENALEEPEIGTKNNGRRGAVGVFCMFIIAIYLSTCTVYGTTVDPSVALILSWFMVTIGATITVLEYVEIHARELRMEVYRLHLDVQHIKQRQSVSVVV